MVETSSSEVEAQVEKTIGNQRLSVTSLVTCVTRMAQSLIWPKTHTPRLSKKFGGYDEIDIINTFEVVLQ